MTDTLIKQIFKRDSIDTIPWKNGGGITRKIAASEPNGGFWCLSIADVKQKGPFSSFPGLHRILTVIEGEGMVLRSPNGNLTASNGMPVSFSGEDEIEGLLPYGPIQDFNLIFDPDVWNGQVNVGTIDHVSSRHWKDADLSAIYCLDGTLNEKSVGELPSTCGAVLESGELTLQGTNTCRLLCVDLRLNNSSVS